MTSLIFVVLLGALSISINVVHAQFGSGEGAGGGGGRGFGFMRAFGEISQGLTPQQREEMKAIFMNPSTPKYQTKQKLRAFFQRIGGPAESRYYALQEQREARKVMMQGMFQQRLASMDPGMRQVMQKIQQLRQNQNISFAQERAQIKQIVATAPPEVRAKFEEMRERFRNGGGFGRGGMMMMGRGPFGGGQGFGGFGGQQGFQQQQQQFNRF